MKFLPNTDFLCLCTIITKYTFRLVNGNIFLASFHIKCLKRVFFFFQAIGVPRHEDKVTKERYLSEKKKMSSLSLPVGSLLQVDRLQVTLGLSALISG